MKETILLDAANNMVNDNVTLWLFKCRICLNEFEKVNDMTIHIETVHGGKKSILENGQRTCTWLYKCAICLIGKSYFYL